MTAETQNLQNELKEKLVVKQNELGLTQSGLAKKLGINAGALSSWLKDSYKGNNAEINNTVEKFLKMQKSNVKRSTELKFINTSISKEVFKAAQCCHLDNEMGVCYGSPGLGKTMATKEYAKNNTGVVIIDCEESMSVRLLLETLYQKLNLGNENSWRLKGMKDKILSKLKDSGWLLIVDEAEWLDEKAFAVLRKLHDRSNCTFGILFLGTHKLYDNLMKFRGQYAYITSRIGYKFELKRLEKNDVEAIVSSVIPDNELLDEIYESTNQNTRVLAKTLKRAIRFAQVNNTEVNRAMIAQSRKMLIV